MKLRSNPMITICSCLSGANKDGRYESFTASASQLHIQRVWIHEKFFGPPIISLDIQCHQLYISHLFQDLRPIDCEVPVHLLASCSCLQVGGAEHSPRYAAPN